MPITVDIASTSSYAKSSSSVANKFAIHPGTSFERLPSDLQAMHSVYPFIPLLGSFIGYIYDNLSNLTYESLYSLARICRSIQKCLSGIEYEYPPLITVSQEVYIAQIRMMVCILEDDILRQSIQKNLPTTASGGMILLLPHEMETELQIIESWPLLENLLVYNEYYGTVNLASQITYFISSCKLSRKQ